MLIYYHEHWDNIRIISKLYWGQKANEKIENRATREIEISLVVRPVYILLPLFLFFTKYLSSTMSKQKTTVGIIINEEAVNNIGCVNNTVSDNDRVVVLNISSKLILKLNYGSYEIFTQTK